jgi:hypothetical protein
MSSEKRPDKQPSKPPGTKVTPYKEKPVPSPPKKVEPPHPWIRSKTK